MRCAFRPDATSFLPRSWRRAWSRRTSMARRGRPPSRRRISGESRRLGMILSGSAVAESAPKERLASPLMRRLDGGRPGRPVLILLDHGLDQDLGEQLVTSRRNAHRSTPASEVDIDLRRATRVAPELLNVKSVGLTSTSLSEWNAASLREIPTAEAASSRLTGRRDARANSYSRRRIRRSTTRSRARRWRHVRSRYIPRVINISANEALTNSVPTCPAY